MFALRVLAMMAERKNWKEHNGTVIDTVKGFDVIECEPCGFKHIIPIPSSEELEEIYRDEYYSIEKPLYLERYREDLDWWNLTYSERYDKFEEILTPDRRRILDIGSGPGFFLHHGKKRGWDGLGIEPSKQAEAHSRELGLKIVDEFLSEDIVEGLGQFDVVHMSEVLEHIREPSGIVELSRRLLHPGGLLCIVVPNDYNPFQVALREACSFDPWWVAPPHHINYFSFDSLSRLLVKNGFDIVCHTTTFPIDMFLLMGDNYVGNDRLGRECHKKRMNFEQNLARAEKIELKIELYSALANLGLGREIQIIASKG